MMRALHGILGFFLLLGVIPPHSAMGQESTVYLSSPFQVGARAIGFAGAITGDNPDVSVMYGNPAALAFLDNSSIILTHSLQKSTDVMDENIAAPLFLKKGEVVAIALSVNHVGHLANSEKNGFKVIQYGYDVGYSKLIADDLSLGGTLNVRYARSSDGKLWGLTSSFGAFYYPTPDVSYGIALTGVGSGIKYIFDGTRTFLNSENISKNILAGAVLRFPAIPGHDRILTVSASAQKTFDVNSIYYFGGVEILPYPFIALRVGYLAATKTVEYASFGMGLRFGKWKLDFGMTPSKASDQMYQLTLTTSVWNQMEKIL
jgi:hypothetical protein